MFELPEMITFARQMNDSVAGKHVTIARQGNSPHKFVWYNLPADQFAALAQGKQVGTAYARSKWLFVPLEPGYVLVLGESGGKLLWHPAGAKLPEKYHLWITFDDGSSLTQYTQMWGAMELYERGKELEREYVRGMRPTPVDSDFTLEYFNSLVDSLLVDGKRTAKALLTQEQLIPGLGNSIAQDILFRARLHPRHALRHLGTEQRSALYASICDTVAASIAAGGRSDEVDLYGNPGGYRRVMASTTAGKPCPECGSTVEKLQYLGGSCYFCPSCQV
jgi:formamidopyrimidine-DNA glycosylase